MTKDTIGEDIFPMATKKTPGVRRHRDLEVTGRARSAEQTMSPVLRVLRERMPADTDLETSRLGLLMLWLADDIIRSVNEELEEFEISEKKLDVLLIFAAQAGLSADSATEPSQAMLQTPTGIADYFGITRATATSLLDWLEKRGLVERKRHPTDRRSTPIEITEAGTDLVDRAIPSFWHACHNLSSHLSARDQSDLSRILGKVWLNLKDRQEG
ncbi:MarR family winged helix-turn-helix transcriptional regulator [Novosphingobium terrae]|uniref:MarR family winged helix-turn-helix transcriptional regulator n=1 Tax=Novosphingobium terrae TaxID=2726189 RepID=UPI001F12E75E|nr:MarR family transcriptional regulator [Novosphingobium terrae]